MQVTKEQVSEKFESLPDDIKRAITDDSVSENLKQLGFKYKLRVDKIGDLIDEVGMVMLGFKKTGDFINALSRRLELDRETAESLAIDVDNEVFKKIRESLRSVQFDPGERKTKPVADPDYGHSPARDSLLQEVERHGNIDGEVADQRQAPAFVSSSDYSANSFAESPSQMTPVESDPTPYEQTTISPEEKTDPTKSFKDHLEKKMESAKPIVNADPFN